MYTPYNVCHPYPPRHDCGGQETPGKLLKTLVTEGKAGFMQGDDSDGCREHCNGVLQQRREIGLKAKYNKEK